MGCALSSTKAVSKSSFHHIEETTSTNNAESAALGLSGATETRFSDNQLLRRSYDQLDLFPQCADSTSATPCHELCLDNTGDLKSEAITCNTMVSTESPVRQVMPVHTNTFETGPDSVDVVRPTDMSTLEWIRIHHQYRELQLNDAPSFCDPTHSGDCVSEHWSTRLSPTMRSEISLHPSIALQETEFRQSVISDSFPEGSESHEAQTVQDPNNPTISLIAYGSSVESVGSPVISPSQFETMMAVTSIVNCSPSSTVHSPSGLNVINNPEEMFGHARHVSDGMHLSRPTVTDNMILNSTPSGDAE
ncbi:hypothetical protein D915_000331 [Fasciola hepatica]|uniref:Uncharacterized protein n=1 Tax=Fasciola hepatica TaxID=6192 RepID=A0A4E0RIS7_FASHE|nr:hypothetical protein D915_000331 [Fasciola hepatica]